MVTLSGRVYKGGVVVYFVVQIIALRGGGAKQARSCVLLSVSECLRMTSVRISRRLDRRAMYLVDRWS